jgi:hypothetical protein
MNPQERKSLREKLFNIFEGLALKMGKAGDTYFSFEDFATDMENYEWTLFHAKWKRRLTKNEIKRTSTSLAAANLTGKPLNALANLAWPAVEVDVPWRNIPGYYSILDPVSISDRSRKCFILDVPTNLAEKILVLGDLP